MKIKLISALSACVCAFFFTTSAYAAGSNFPERINGVWKGSGSIHKSPGAPRERVRCRMSSKWNKTASSVALRYICLGVDVKFETFGTLKYNTGKKSISGRLTTVGIGVFRASGRNRGNRVTLSLAGKDKKTGKPTKGVLSISLSGKSKLISSLSATDPKTGKRFQAFKASFRR